ncbi:MAG: hypothetical protein JWP78_1667 [Mucilaginibacter sp.]|nr:hypothetical protein [Mucilaginibacter sp.]
MKKLLSIVCCAVVLLSVSSCTKQYITPNPNQTVFADLTSSSWTPYTDGTGSKSYQAPVNVKELDGGSTQYDGIIVAISYDGGTTYEQLPEVYGGTSFSYTYNAGMLTLYAQSPDGGTAILPTDPIKVKITLVFSN